MSMMKFMTAETILTKEENITIISNKILTSILAM